MVRQVVCDTKFEIFLTGLGKTSKLSIGLIIGQIASTGKDLIIHLAKTPLADKKTEEPLEKVTDIENSQVAEHALNTTRMLPAGFNVLGLFVVTETSLMSDTASLQKLKTVLMDIKSTLDSNGLLYANTDELDKGDKLLLNFVSGHKNFICKTISTDPSKSTASNPVDWKFSKGLEWQEFNTYYEIDTFFPLPHANNHFDTEKNVMATIDTIAQSLNSSLLFFNGAPLDKELTLEKLNKQNKSSMSEKMKVTIYGKVPKLAQTESGKLKPSELLVQYTGVICSRVFGASRNTIGEVETFIKNDIIRSLTTRMQIYYDALLANDDGGNDDETEEDQDVNNTVLPRRVFYPIGNGSILFGDYLFQNESAETTVKQSMDILSINLSTADVITNAEAVAQLNNSSQEKSDTSNSENEEVLTTKDTGRVLLIVGIFGALIALLVAIVLHFVMK